MKKASYHGQKFLLPDNISISIAKKVINECGKDYCITVQSVLNLISKIKSK